MEEFFPIEKGIENLIKDYDSNGVVGVDLVNIITKEDILAKNINHKSNELWMYACTKHKLPSIYIDEFIDVIPLKGLCFYQELGNNHITRILDRLNTQPDFWNALLVQNPNTDKKIRKMYFHKISENTFFWFVMTTTSYKYNFDYSGYRYASYNSLEHLEALSNQEVEELVNIWKIHNG